MSVKQKNYIFCHICIHNLCQTSQDQYMFGFPHPIAASVSVRYGYDYILRLLLIYSLVIGKLALHGGYCSSSSHRNTEYVSNIHNINFLTEYGASLFSVTKCTYIHTRTHDHRNIQQKVFFSWQLDYYQLVHFTSQQVNAVTLISL